MIRTKWSKAVKLKSSKRLQKWESKKISQFHNIRLTGRPHTIWPPHNQRTAKTHIEELNPDGLDLRFSKF